MADMIREANNETEPGETERWTLVGPVQGALRFLLRDLPVGVVAWGKMAEVLRSIDWHALARSLPGS